MLTTGIFLAAGAITARIIAGLLINDPHDVIAVLLALIAGISAYTLSITAALLTISDSQILRITSIALTIGAYNIAGFVIVIHIAWRIFIPFPEDDDARMHLIIDRYTDIRRLFPLLAVATTMIVTLRRG